MYKMYICSVVNADILCTFAVAPYTGAWIEMNILGGMDTCDEGRSPYGSVD